MAKDLCYFLTTVNTATMNLGIRSLFDMLISFPLSKPSSGTVELPNHMLCSIVRF